MAEPMRFLFVEDSPEDTELLLFHLKKAGLRFDHERVDTEAGLRSSLTRIAWDAIICDYCLPGMNALSAIPMMKELCPDIPVIVVSGSIGEECAVETMKVGASDYLMKDKLHRLVPAIERGLKERKFRTESRGIEESLRRREEELRQAQKLEAIGQLAGGIAHDFNNILASILVQVDFLADELEHAPRETLVEEIRRGLKQISDAGSRASSLTRQLLAFSRKQVLQPRVLNLNVLVRDLEKMLRPIVEENIEIRLTLASDLGNIKVDPGHVEQVLMNLVINSRDALPDGGLIEVETRNASVDEAEARQSGAPAPGEYVLVSVRDNGSGISPEVQKRLFEPFFTTKPVGKGTGLGLSTVYGIVKQNEGFIFLESELGKGTVFKVYFPRVNEKAQGAAAPRPVSKELTGTETILFVEDESSLRDVVSKTLAKNGYRTITASNGIEALEILRSHPDPIHLIITDVVMPQMGGTELAEKARELHKGVRILFQSGYTEDTLIHNGLKTGQISFLEKPYNMKDLLHTVRRTLSHS